MFANTLSGTFYPTFKRPGKPTYPGGVDRFLNDNEFDALMDGDQPCECGKDKKSILKAIEDHAALFAVAAAIGGTLVSLVTLHSYMKKK